MSAPAVAAFDFDGTLSTRDNVMPFLVRVAGKKACARAVAEGSAGAVRRGRSGLRRDALKEEVVAHLLTGRDAAEMEELALDFANEVWHDHLRSEAVQLADWHRTQGHRLVIVSASFGIYLRRIGERLRFDGVLATELEVGPDGRFTGSLAGANCRGAEKVRRLDEWIGETPDTWPPTLPPVVYAYGDGGGDRELWARADHAVRLGRRAALGTGTGAASPFAAIRPRGRARHG